MFDTVNFWIDRGDITNGKSFVILPYLSDVTESFNNRQGYSANGKIKGYDVRCYDAGIILKGSLAKFLLPSNIYTLTRKDTQQAIELMSDALHLNIGTAKITRVDVSTVIPTNHPPKDYYNYLGDKARFKRLQPFDNTLYYRTQKRQLVFYDKAKWANDKNVSIPPPLQGLDNLLRYEMRLTSRLQSQLQTETPIMASMLYDKTIYYKLVKMWQSEFETINKLKETISLNDVKTPSGAKNALLAQFLRSGGQKTIDDFLRRLKSENAFKDKSQYSKLRSDLINMIQAKKTEQKSDLVKELEKAVKDVARYAR